MRVTILYVDQTKLTREHRWDLGENLLPADCYTEVDTFEAPDDSYLYSVCETLFEKYQALDTPVSSTKGVPLRSMSVGDIITIGAERFICARVGFTAIPASV